MNNEFAHQMRPVQFSVRLVDHFSVTQQIRSFDPDFKSKVDKPITNSTPLEAKFAQKNSEQISSPNVEFDHQKFAPQEVLL